jgi:hypothetical protein
MNRPVVRRGGDRSGRSRVIACAALIALAAMASAASAMAQTESPDRPAVQQEHSAGGVRLALEVDRQELAIDGRIRVSVQLEVPDGRLAALPDLSDEFGPFAVVAQSSAESSSAGGTVLLRRYYDLEPQGVGDLTVPSLVVAVP